MKNSRVSGSLPVLGESPKNQDKEFHVHPKPDAKVGSASSIREWLPSSKLAEKPEKKPSALRKGAVFKIISGKTEASMTRTENVENYLSATYHLIESVAKTKECKREEKVKGPLGWLKDSLRRDIDHDAMPKSSLRPKEKKKCWCEDIPSEDATAAFRIAGDVHFRTRNYDQALNAMNHELSIKRNTLGSKHQEIGRMLNYMGVMMGQMDPEHEFMALMALEEALMNLQGSVGPGDEETAIACHNMWVLLHNAWIRQESPEKKMSTTKFTPVAPAGTKRNVLGAMSA
uniref:Kinesin light chain n=1 Tax=Pseudictyota dubia TaxID=2749911 RepID=A0A6U2FYF6_9STRA|mmetsp:Transcript_41007/g.75849  ORF Transcript_41007/g.75849 Transcript_41007/m.75849 type:complete len:287 (+) Transcript_41007:110-970(+)